jgi:hypothetical protein
LRIGAQSIRDLWKINTSLQPSKTWRASVNIVRDLYIYLPIMQIKSAFVAAAILAFCDALAIRSPYVVKETHFVPKEWQKQDRAHGGETISLQIGLKQGKFEELDRHLHEGKHYAKHTE